MEEKSEIEKQDNPKISILAIISFVLAILIPFTSMLTTIPAFVLGITSLLKIRKSPTRMKGKSFAIIGIAIPSVIIMLVILSVTAKWTGNLMLEIARNRQKSRSTNLSGIEKAMQIYGNDSYQHTPLNNCYSNLSSLMKAIRIYLDDYDSYPTPAIWCDLLIQECNVPRDNFLCPLAKEGPCNYALNINIADLGMTNDPNIVVLFETSPGWNQVGVPEILTLENHKGKGCNVVFLDSHVEFIKAEDISKLKWKPD